MKILVAFMWLIAIFQSSLEIDTSQCGTTVTCLRSPKDCISDKCDVAAIWSKQPNRDVLNFEMTAKQSTYVSIGFSKDQAMGEDSVIDCIDNLNSVIVQASYNVPDKRENEVLTLSNEAAGLTLISSSSAGGFITCKFTRNITVPGQEVKVFDLSAQKYYVMLAYGSVKTVTLEKEQHTSSSRILSTSAINVTSPQTLDSSSDGSRKSVLHQTHGVLMIAAWVLLASMGMFIARYYKPAWPNSKLLNTKVWFVVHRSTMVLTLLCTVVAFILIYVQVKQFSQVSGETSFLQAHPPMGIAITALVIINPIMTFFRCHPGAKYRAVFDWAHFGVGMSALILSFINVYSGVKLGGFKDSVMWVMTAYIGFYVLVMVVMEGHKFLMSPKQRESKSNSMEMSSSSASKENTLASILTFKYSMLVVFFSVTIGLFAIMVILIVVD